MILKGKVFKYGSNIDTDIIIAACYLNRSEPDFLASHCMENVEPDFIKLREPGDIIVAEKNFGCGSSREHAPIAIKAAQISCVIAESFARIFYRNSINIGLPIIECKEASEKIQKGDRLEINLEDGKIKNLTQNEEYTFKPLPDFAREIISAGGLMAYVTRK